MTNWKIYAILAAICNASIGILSKGAFHIGLSPQSVAFYKCLIAFIILSPCVLAYKKNYNHIPKKLSHWLKIAVCAFFGIFILYFFETAAYAQSTISTVVFILLGSSAVTTIILSKFLNKEEIGPFQMLGFLLAISGVFCMFREESAHFISMGSFLAIVAGIGYGLFLSLSKKLTFDTSSIAFLWIFIGFGTLFLSIPVMLYHHAFPTITEFKYLIPLSIIPTIGGYYCTSKALHFGTSSKVQLFELTEPLFASVFGYVFLREWMSDIQLVGALLILVAIHVFGMKSWKFYLKKQVQ